MEITNRKRGFFTTIAIIILIGSVFALSCVFGNTIGVDYSDTFYDLSNDWHLGETTDGESIMTAELKKGESITITANTRFLPQSVNAATLLIITDSCTMEVYCYDTLLYTYGLDAYEQHDLVGSGTHMINFPTDYMGQPVTVKLTAARNGAKLDTHGFGFGDIDAVARSFTQKKGSAIVVSGFLIAFGSMLILLQFIMYDKNHFSFDFIFQGLLLSDLGIFLACYNNLMRYILRDDIINTYTLYISLIFIPYLIYMAQLSSRNQKKTTLNSIILIIDITIAVVLSILNATGIIYINELSGYICIFVGIHILLTMIWILVTGFVKKENKELYSYATLAMQTVRLGLCILTFCCLLDLIVWKFDLSRALMRGSDVRGLFVMPGALVLSGCIFIGYFYHCVAIAKDSDVSEKLKDLAYTDKLTGLSNRAHCERIMFTLQSEGTDCTVISLDLDGLKAINDKQGHQQGDLYISGFAEILKKSFSDALLCWRMGGDEFIIILNGLNKNNTESCLKLLEGNTKASSGFDYRYSYGYAGTDEIADKHLQAVYMLADERMYQMKDEHHKADRSTPNGAARQEVIHAST